MPVNEIPTDPLGLGSAEWAAYELLVDRPSATLAEMSASWDRTEPLGPVLTLLEDRGLISTATDGVTRYRAVAPAAAFQGPLLDYEEELDAARQRMIVLDAAYRSSQPERDPPEPVEVVAGRRAVEGRLAQLWRGVRREMRCLDTHPTGTAPGAAELLGRGRACRTIYDPLSLSQPGSLAAIDNLIRAGQQARVLPQLPLRLCVADDRLAVLPLSGDAILLVYPSALLDVLVKLFDGLWQRAMPLHQPAAQRATARPPAQQRLVSLLLSGLTDEAIGRQLGISHRTVQRRIAELMAELGAQTRFQAGAQAALRGYYFGGSRRSLLRSTRVPAKPPGAALTRPGRGPRRRGAARHVGTGARRESR
jgi:DNA-binding CsgD family transcriptional regulator